MTYKFPKKCYYCDILVKDHNAYHNHLVKKHWEQEFPTCSHKVLRVKCKNCDKDFGESENNLLLEENT